MVNEALLEMLYFEPLLHLYEKKLGRKFLRVLKPSPQQEVWVGFDQGWASARVESSELLQQLRGAVQEDEKKVQSLYFGYFLQFKSVSTVTRSSRSMPDNYSTPYFRVALSLKSNSRTGMSQHETLKRLSEIENTKVYYACPMIFTEDEVLERPVNLEKLRYVDVQTAPQGWNTNENHYIAFETVVDSSPVWCSKPVPGSSINVDEWLAAVDILNSLMSPKQTEEFLSRLSSAYSDDNRLYGRREASAYPSQLTLVEFAAQ